MKPVKHIKLYDLFNDINAGSKKHLNENHDNRVLRKAREYCKTNNIENGIKPTFTTGTRTWENFGIFQYEKPREEYEEGNEKETLEEKERKRELELELRYIQLENEWSRNGK